MWVPVRFLIRRKGVVEVGRDDVFDTRQPRRCGIAVEEGALREVFVHLVAVVMGLHLHRRVVFGRIDHLAEASTSRRPGRACAILVSEEGDMAKPTIGFIGAGHIGSQVARLAISCGYPVVISNSRGPETLAALVARTGTECARCDGRGCRQGRRHRRGHHPAQELPRRAGGAARGQDRDRHQQLLSRSVTATFPSSTTSRRRPPSSCRRTSRPRRSSRRSTISTRRN